MNLEIYHTTLYDHNGLCALDDAIAPVLSMINSKRHIEKSKILNRYNQSEYVTMRG